MGKIFSLVFRNNYNTNEMKASENYGLICPKCGEEMNTEKINDITLNNNKIKNYINDIELQIEIIIKNNSNDLLNNITNILKIIKEDIKKNDEIILNLLNNKNKFNNIFLDDNNKKEISNKKMKLTQKNIL